MKGPEGSDRHVDHGCGLRRRGKNVLQRRRVSLIPGGVTKETTRYLNPTKERFEDRYPGW